MVKMLFILDCKSLHLPYILFRQCNFFLTQKFLDFDDLFADFLASDLYIKTILSMMFLKFFLLLLALAHFYVRLVVSKIKHFFPTGFEDMRTDLMGQSHVFLSFYEMCFLKK